MSNRLNNDDVQNVEENQTWYFSNRIYFLLIWPERNGSITKMSWKWKIDMKNDIMLNIEELMLRLMLNLELT